MKAKTNALDRMKKLRVKSMGKPYDVKKETTLTNDWKKGKKFHFSEQN